MNLKDGYFWYYDVQIIEGNLKLKNVDRHIISNNPQKLCLFIDKKGVINNYITGHYDYDGNFYSAPIYIDENITLISVEEREATAFTFGITEEEKKASNNPKGIEVKLEFRLENKAPFLFHYYVNNNLDIIRALQHIKYIKLFIGKKLPISKLKNTFDLTVPLMVAKTSNYVERVYNYLKSFKSYSWTEVKSRAGKDNACYSGTYLISEIVDDYLSTLISKNTKFVKKDNHTFSYFDDVDYAYIPSSKYSESEPKEIYKSNTFWYLLEMLIKNFNKDDCILIENYFE